MSIPRILRLVAPSLVLGLVLAGVPGCIKSAQTTRIKKDGSGQVTLTAIIDKAKLDQMKEMMNGMMPQGAGGPAGKDPAEEMSPETLREVAKGSKGIHVVSVEKTEDKEAGTETFKTVVNFDSLQALFESGLIQQTDVKLEKLENGNYRFEFEIGAGQDIPDTPEAQEQVQMVMQMFEPILSGFEIKRTMVLPTALVDTNGDRSIAGEVTWTLDGKNLMDAKKRRQVVTFSGEGLDWKPFSLDAKKMEKLRQESMKRAREMEEKDKEQPPAPPSEGR